jgi:SAM-dependent methyltransferase
LNLSERFERIQRTNLWGAVTSVSGLGSEVAATAAVRVALPALLQDLNVRSVLDAPCGDAGWIAEATLGVEYCGLDIVLSLIAANAAQAQEDQSGRRFLVADITKDVLPCADLVICRDALVHLSFNNIALAIERFRLSGSRWLLTTTFTHWEVNQEIEDGDWRALNLQRAPFSWPEPARLINECCEEAEGGWRDKSLGAWLLNDLPTPAVRL